MGPSIKPIEALAEIRQRKAEFEDAVNAANATGTTYDMKLPASVCTRFDQIENELNNTNTQSEIDGLIARANELARLKAYVCPPGEILLSGTVALSTMEEWSVPQSALESLKKESIPLLSKSSDLNAARGALYTVLQEYDSWDSYIDQYNTTMGRVTYILACLFLLSLGGTIWAINSFSIPLGLILAGACGAFVSVVSKVPTLNVYGDEAPYIRGICKRVCIGIAASMIGVAFLATGLFTVTLPNGGSLHDMIQTCTRLPSSESATSNNPEISAESVPMIPVRPAKGSASCDTKEKLILVGLVVLFGFSERALTSFEERVFPAKP